MSIRDDRRMHSILHDKRRVVALRAMTSGLCIYGGLLLWCAQLKESKA